MGANALIVEDRAAYIPNQKILDLPLVFPYEFHQVSGVESRSSVVCMIQRKFELIEDNKNTDSKELQNEIGISTWACGPICGRTKLFFMWIGNG